jgi:hypothetical protein
MIVGYSRLSQCRFWRLRMYESESEELERLTYLIVGKVGPRVLIRYNALRDRLRAKYENKRTS